jgi:hypothetical protein
MPDRPWIRVGAVAGLVFVLISLIAAALPGAPPQADGNPVTYQNYFVTHHNSLITQAWLYALAVPLMLIFAASVRRILRRSSDDGYLSELFFTGTAAVATLLVVTQAMQVAVAERADGLTAEVVFTVGVHFPGVLIGLWGFIVGLTALAFAYCVFAYGALPRWTGYLALLVLVTDVVSSAGVFFRSGAFCLEGGFSAWAPAASMLLWYLGTSIAMLRIRDRASSTLAA